MIDVSVVVPVYNAEEYLPQCIESLISQTLQKIEIIFVDDGSTDNSVEILERYQKNDDRIKIIKQKNQYAGVARNNGMDHASGKYIIFLDSDDFFDSHMLQEMYKSAEETCADVVIAGFYEFDDQKMKVQKIETTILSGVVSTDSLGKNIFTITNGAPWNKLFLREYINSLGIKFQALKSSNDTFFTRMSVALSKKIVFIPKAYVYYRVNNSQSIQGAVTKNSFVFGEAIKGIKEELVNRGMYKGDVRVSFLYETSGMINYYLSKADSADEYDRVFTYSKDLLQEVLEESDLLIDGHVGYALSLILKSKNATEYLLSKLREYQSKLYKCEETLSELRDSTISMSSATYKAGRLLLYIPSKVKALLQGRINRHD